MLVEPMALSRLRELGGQAARWEGSFSAEAMVRLRGLLHPEADLQEHLLASVRVKMRQDNFPAIECSLTGHLGLSCQRCFDLYEWPVLLSFELAVVGSEQELEGLDDRFDAVIADRQGMTLLEVIEDELLSALPLAPLHDQDHACAAGRVALDTGNVSAVLGPPVQIEKNRPFADLDALLRPGAGRGGSNES